MERSDGTAKKKVIAMERTIRNTEDLKRDKNFTPTSIKFLRRKRRIRWAAVVIVAAGFGVLAWLCLHSAGLLLASSAPAWALVGIALVVVRFVLKIISALISSLLLILIILLLCGVL